MERFGDLPAIVPAPAAPPVASTVARSMLFKNFGLARLGRVVFYDYDEIQTMTEMNFRRIPPAPDDEAELASEPWYPVGANDVFPEEFARFLLGDARVRRRFMHEHADLLDADYWQAARARNRRGRLDDIFPYDTTRRFARTLRGAGPASAREVPPS